MHKPQLPDPFDIPEEELCGLPKRLYLHLFCGRVSQGGKIYGVHHHSALAENPNHPNRGDFAVVPETIIRHDHGFYEATVAHWNGHSWQPRQGHTAQQPLRNGFFPDHWSRREVMEAVYSASTKITTADWIPPVVPRKKSNVYLQTLTCGQAIVFYLGTPKRNRPKKVDTYIASVFPIFK